MGVQVGEVRGQLRVGAKVLHLVHHSHGLLGVLRVNDFVFLDGRGRTIELFIKKSMIKQSPA